MLNIWPNNSVFQHHVVEAVPDICENINDNHLTFAGMK